MKFSGFPARIKLLEPFSDRFEAFKLAAEGCDVLFATYPAGTVIDVHNHSTDNWGVITKGKMLIATDGQESEYLPGDWYHVPAGQNHSARCDVETEEIELWFSNKLSKSDFSGS